MAEPLAELTVRPGSIPPSDLPQGNCILTSLYDDHGQPAGIRVGHADPRILVSAELLETAAVSPADGVSLDTTDCCDCMMKDDYTKAVLKIAAVNRTVIYRIVDYVPSVHGYIAEWPD